METEPDNEINQKKVTQYQINIPIRRCRVNPNPNPNEKANLRCNSALLTRFCFLPGYYRPLVGNHAKRFYPAIVTLRNFYK